MILLKALKAHLFGALLTTLLWVGLPLVQSIRAGESLAVSLDVAAPLFVMVAVMVFLAALPVMATVYPLVRRMAYTSLTDWLLAGAVFGMATGLMVDGLVIDADAWHGALLEHYLRCILAGLAFGGCYWNWMVKPKA